MASREDIQRPISLINPKSPLTESYRTLRTNIQFASVAEVTKVARAPHPAGERP
ncbi:hypothetical protein [Alicyclobacillus hesperidum]|uniref:hypothetical protein n=1 Tax=Alicyclobacillus hesperidum TaxID=89784 RepID=UPI0024E0E43B|nr:hypothetical protein [Alicyclobacillus hesperidum]